MAAAVVIVVVLVAVVVAMIVDVVAVVVEAVVVMVVAVVVVVVEVVTTVAFTSVSAGRWFDENDPLVSFILALDRISLSLSSLRLRYDFLRMEFPKAYLPSRCAAISPCRYSAIAPYSGTCTGLDTLYKV